MGKKNQFQVDFFIVGQAKSGTTALASFLGQHPDICISSPKEPGFFAKDIIKESDKYYNGKSPHYRIRSLSDYKSIFKDHEKVLGEASTSYIYSKKAAGEIYKHNKDAKIIIMLRNPIDFLHSLHMQYVNERAEDITDFTSALEAEKHRKLGKKIPREVRAPSLLYYSKRTRYAEHIHRYMKYFPEKNILILINEEFSKDNAAAYKTVLGFIGVDSKFRPEFKTIHGSRVPRSNFMHSVAHNNKLKLLAYKVLGPTRYEKTQKKIEKLIFKSKQREPLTPELYSRLKESTSTDVIQTEKLLGRDLKEVWRIE